MKCEKMKYKIFCLILLNAFSLNILFAQQNIDLNCLTIIVGKNASSDGSVIVAHNEDDWGKQIVNLYKSPQRIHNEDEIITLDNGGKINQIKNTNGFIWIELPGMSVSDTYLNDKGVLITSDGCPSREDKPDSTDGGILYWIRRIIAERAESAKQGVKLAGKLIEHYGYASPGRSYTIADKNEAWVLAVVHGKYWVAQRVPDNQISVIPNYYTIREINLADTNNFLGSSDIISYAEKRGWYNSENNEKFDFAEVYTSKNSINHPGNINRIWRGINLLSENVFNIKDKFPFSFKPFKKVEVTDLMNILRDHYENSELDESKFYKFGNPHYKNYATICSEATQYSFVAQLRNNLPVEIGSILWFTYYRPCLNLFTPIYLGINDFPNDFNYTDEQQAIKFHLHPKEEIFDSNSALKYWDFVKLTNYVDKDFLTFYPSVKSQKDILQNDLIIETKRFENRVMEIYLKDRESALDMVSGFSKDKLIQIHNTSKEFLNSIKIRK